MGDEAHRTVRKMSSILYQLMTVMPKCLSSPELLQYEYGCCRQGQPWFETRFVRSCRIVAVKKSCLQRLLRGPSRDQPSSSAGPDRFRQKLAGIGSKQGCRFDAFPPNSSPVQ